MPDPRQRGASARRRTSLLLLSLALLAGCATGPRYTVDDGRPVDEALLRPIRQYVAGERALRPAIARSAALDDPDCDRQWELPFALASSQAWDETARVGWARVAGVDERLTVVAVAPGSPLALGEHVMAAGKVRDPEDVEAMSAALAWLRDAGEPFGLRTDRQREVKVQPLQVCRGLTRLAPPSTPLLQDYHWLMSMHPLEVASAGLSEDEALWIVLWTQGLSEEGGMRMKAYHYTTSTVGTLFSIASLASGLKGAAVAAEAAMSAAKSAAANAVADAVKQQLLDQARAYAEKRLREGLVDAAGKLTQQQAVAALQQVALHRGTLSGVARVGATVFDRADAWAFARAGRLGANRLAGFSLHQKLLQAGATQNALAFDAERLAAISATAEAAGLRESVLAILQGLRPEALDPLLYAMPLASQQALFRYDDSADDALRPFGRGLINNLLEMPLESKASR